MALYASVGSSLGSSSNSTLQPQFIPFRTPICFRPHFSLFEHGAVGGRRRSSVGLRLAVSAASDASSPSTSNKGDTTGRRTRSEELAADVGHFVSVQKVLAASILAGCVLGLLNLDRAPFVRWLSQFGGFAQRISADHLFLDKAAIEGAILAFNKTALEYDRRNENFLMEWEVVLLHVVVSAITNFLLLYLTAPNVSLGSPLGTAARPIETFLCSCPPNAFQVARAGASYSLLQRIAAFGFTGVKLFVVGTTLSLVGKAMENTFINLRKAINKSSAGEIVMVPIVSKSIACGLYIAVFGNLRYQVLSGIVEQRILEPLLIGDPLILCTVIFAIRAGNAYLGSLLRIVTYEKDNASSLNELVEPKSNVTGGTSNQDNVPLLRLFDMSLYISVVEGKLELKLKRITLS